MKKTIYEIIFVLSIILACGTAGACDMNIISFTQACIQEVISVLCIIGSKYLISLEERRGN